MAAAAMAGEIRIIFMTGLANPLVILESVRLLPGAQHSRPPRSCRACLFWSRSNKRADDC